MSDFTSSGFLRGFSASFWIIMMIFLIGLMTMRSASFEKISEAAVSTKHVKIVVANYRVASSLFSY